MRVGRSGILCARPISSLAGEPLAEDDSGWVLASNPSSGGRSTLPLLGRGFSTRQPVRHWGSLPGCGPRRRSLVSCLSIGPPLIATRITIADRQSQRSRSQAWYQMASKTDAGSASNFAPLCSARLSAFARAELVRIAQPGRARMRLAADGVIRRGS